MLAFPRPYHGSQNRFEAGFVLQPQSHGYVNADDEMVAQTERIIEVHRPANALPRSSSVFMCADIGEIDFAGGYLDFVYEVAPDGQAEKNDMAWYSAIGVYLWDDENGAEVAALVQGYWSGRAQGGHHTLFEYRSRTAKILKLVEAN
jgi:hypothetical protein